MDTLHHKIEALIQVDGGWLHFRDPVRIVQAWHQWAVAGALAEVDVLTRQDGQYAVGFVCYEAAAAFGLAVHPRRNDDTLPLVWFGLFDASAVDRLSRLPFEPASYELGPLVASVDRSAFDAAFRRIKYHLAEGDSYQVNYTFRLEGAFHGCAQSLFASLTAAQRGQHSAFICLGTHSICSASPELFFERAGSFLSARPMKGTAARGRTLVEDLDQRDRLRSSDKERAENLMIVDMVRNDFGRIADVGSVHVEELFAVERYPSMWQMTSLVTARSSAPLQDLFAALHPSASVTGAPKVSTMAILNQLEDGPRGVYTGAIGHVNPGGDARFNVAIRTAMIDHRSQVVEFGIGSGIVWDSDVASEYRECLLKGSVLGGRQPDFELLETLRWTPDGGFLLLERHLLRMRESAEYFGFSYDEASIQTALGALLAAPASLASPQGWRVRLLLSREGTVRVEHRALESSKTPMAVRLADEPIDPQDPFLFHKTTNRAVYDRARACTPVNQPKPDEVILWNAMGQITEATTANVVVDVGGELVTPPVECGLLGGTFRAEVVARGEARTAVVTLDQLQAASRIWLINSVHEWREARLIDGHPGQIALVGQVGQAGHVGQAGKVGQVGQAGQVGD